jgi:hypothetical protein
MKLRKTALLILPVMLGATLLTGCETTGNPREGGLFGWSETKAQGRIREREEYLDAVESDTAYQRRRSRHLENTIDNREAELDSYR